MAMSSTDELSSFEIDTAEALSNVRSALSQLIRSLNAEVRRSADLQRVLDLDSKLAWQVFNLAHDEDPCTGTKLVPGAPSLHRLQRAAIARGVPEAVVSRVCKAISAFDSVVERHAEDRTEFEGMVAANWSGPSSAGVELAQRRTAFRAESQIWGVNAGVLGSTVIVRRAANGDGTDECCLVNKLECRRLRRDASLSVVAYRNYGAEGVPAGRTRLPLDAGAAERYGAHLLPQFCSQPIPMLRTWLRPDGLTAVDVQSTQIGRQNAVNMVLGQIFRNCPLARDLENRPYFQADMRIGTPARLLLSYLLVHRPSFGSVRPSLHAFRQAPGDESNHVAHSVMQLPTREEVRYLGTGKSAWHTADIPDHDTQVDFAFNEIGWNPSEFDVFRVRMEYPVLHSVVRIGMSV